MIDPYAFYAVRAAQELRTKGATSFPLLSEETRVRLLKEARSYDYHDRTGIVGKARVEQELAAFQDFPSHSAFHALREDFLAVVCGGLAEAGLTFEPALEFNELVLQKYACNSRGIGPHIDSKRCRNLVAVFLLDGDGDFAICNDRDKTNAEVIMARPGHVILMTAIGLCGRTEQQFHFLDNIREGRLTFGMRHLHPPGSIG